MRRLILGTAGHIDHGKTALVRALTGIDTDRLPEEKRRGITIELGFAALSLDGVAFGIVDVPGHEALVRTMLAGAAGMDLVMLVIAADEGVMPQTREHLAIMELLEVRAAVVALTKADLVDAEWLELVRADVADTIRVTRFGDAPIVPVSAKNGQGLDTLRREIGRIAERVDPRPAADLFRLPVDRSFTRHGTGTVVTGTVWSGVVARDTELRIWPADTAARARGLHVHGEARDAAGAGERVAIALAVDRDAVRRGDTIAAGDGWQPSMLITARVDVLASGDRPLRHRQRIRFHLGTAELLGRVAVLDGEEIECGASGWVQLRLESPCIARAGDHFVIRSWSPVHTIAGGIVAEPAPPKRKRMSDELEHTLEMILGDDLVAAIRGLLASAGGRGVAVAGIPLRTRSTPATADAALGTVKPLRIGNRVYDASLGRAARALIIAAVEKHHATVPLDAGLPREALRGATGMTGPRVTGWAVDRLIADGQLRSEQGVLALAGFTRSLDQQQHATADALLEAVLAAGLEVPSTMELGTPAPLKLLRFLADQARITALPGDRWIGTAALGQLLGRLADAFEPGQHLSTTDLKDAIGVSRKYLIPILEHLDRTGFTRRTGDIRVWIGDGGRHPETSQTTAVPAL